MPEPLRPNDLLQELIRRCRNSVYVSVNEHRNLYLTVGQWLVDHANDTDIAPDVRHQMLEIDTIVDVQFYPDTAIGYHRVLHYDLEVALTEALALLP